MTTVKRRYNRSWKHAQDIFELILVWSKYHSEDEDEDEGENILNDPFYHKISTI